MKTREEKMAAYANKFRVDAPGEEPTDENLSRVLAHCALKPKPEWYNEIRWEWALARIRDMEHALAFYAQERGLGARLASDGGQIARKALH